MCKFCCVFKKDLKIYNHALQPRENDYIRLNTNENPYGPSPNSIKSVLKLLNENLRLYPDYNLNLLKKSISENYKINIKQVFVGNGSDEVLSNILYAFCRNGKLLMPNITYSFYNSQASLFKIILKKFKLSNNFKINIKNNIMKDIKCLIFPNPNAPTGIFLNLSYIEYLIKKNPNILFIIDEAYIDFGGKTAIPLVLKYNNIIILQTLSKSRSLAGLRIGFAISNYHLIESLNNVQNSLNSYPLNTISNTFAAESILDHEYFEKTRNLIIKERERLSTSLKNMNFHVLPSFTNFIFVKHNSLSGDFILNYLYKNKILVRIFNTHERIKNFLRITIGTHKQMSILINVLNKICI